MGKKLGFFAGRKQMLTINCFLGSKNQRWKMRNWNVLAKGYFNIEKLLVEAIKDFLHLTQSVQKTSFASR